jgi:hypothetical protein
MSLPKSDALLPDLDGIEARLQALVGSGWTSAQPSLAEPLEAPAAPLPVSAPQTTYDVVASAPPAGLAYAPEPVLPARRERTEDQEPEPAHKAILDVGLLADFVTGARSANDTAEAAGVTINELHSALATTLQHIDAKELAKAMGVQIAVTQLKAGAVFNALLADLVEDIRMGRAKADTKIELMKILKGVGRLEPKEDKGIGAGSGFQLNINIGAGTPPVVIESN